MNFALLSKVLGTLLLLLSLAMTACLGFSLLELKFGLVGSAPRALMISAAVTFICGFGLYWFGRHSTREVLRKEAIAIVGLGWLLCGAFGALPYLFTTPALPPAAALFESYSGFTTTGSTVIRDLTLHSHSSLLWRSTTQWLGGMGILVLFVALLSYLGVGSKSLFRHESSASSTDSFHSRIHGTAVVLWRLYIALSLICFLGLLFLGMNLFDALTHAFATMSTGGFSPRNESIAFYNNVWIELWITLFMFLGGVSFVLMASLFVRGGKNRWATEEETKAYCVILLIATLAIAANIAWGRSAIPLPDALRQSLFQVVSIMTTTGFATADFDQWPAFSKAILVLLMFIGGCAGSTSGGIKVGRLLLFFKISRQELIAAFRPTQVIPLRLNGQNVSDSLKPQTLFFISLTGVVLAVSTLAVTLLEPQMDIVSSFSATVTTLFNIGPGLGSVGATMNFSTLRPPTHLLLSILMVLGRLELFAILVLFVPSLWRKY